jgi:hypothetical protein
MKVWYSVPGVRVHAHVTVRDMTAIFKKLMAATAVLIVVSQMPGNSQESATAEPSPAREVFKNIQVLGDLPADQLIPTMQFMAKSLGVECSHCHEEDREKDVKRQKRTARKMLRMVYDLNQKNFMRPSDAKGQVTCNSCHHGNRIPGKFER